jgi:hypothetical protein
MMEILSWLLVAGLAVAALAGVQAFDVLTIDLTGGW